MYCYFHFINQEIKICSKANGSFMRSGYSTQLNAAKKPSRTGLKSTLDICPHDRHCDGNFSEEENPNSPNEK